jgi:hypothetical protein
MKPEGAKVARPARLAGQCARVRKTPAVPGSSLLRVAEGTVLPRDKGQS